MVLRQYVLLACTLYYTVLPSVLFSQGRPSISGNTGFAGPDFQGITTLDALIEEAVNNNLKLKSLRSRIDAAEKKIPQAGSWADPKLSVGLMSLPVSQFDLGLEPMTQKQVGLMQRIPIPGITELRRNSAEKDRTIEELQYTEERNAVVKNVSQKFFELCLIDRSIRITEDKRTLFNGMADAARSKYEVGEGILQDVLKAQLESSRLHDRLITLQGKRNRTVYALNRLIGRNQEEQVDNTSAIDLTIDDYGNIDELMSGFENNPVIQRMKQNIEKRRIAADLSRKQYLPFIDLGVTYGQRQGRRDFLSALVSVSLPVWSSRKQSKAVEESVIRIQTAEEELDNTIDDIQMQVRSLMSELNDIRERIKLLEEIIIPQAGLSVESAHSAYQVGKADFLTLLNSHQVLLNSELSYYERLSEYRKKRAELDFIIGKRF